MPAWSHLSRFWPPVRSAARRGSLSEAYRRGDLVPCNGVLGECDIRAHAPALTTHRNALYVPRDRRRALEHDPGWGIYTQTGDLIAASAYRRGPGPVRVSQSDTTDLRPSRVARAPEARYLYIGVLHRHFGHFLLSGLARLWPRLVAGLGGTRLLYHGEDSPDQIFEFPFMAASLGALGIGPGDLAHAREPLALDEVLVPAPSYEESHLAHRVHADVGAAIGLGLRGGASPAPGDRRDTPVFLSRTGLTTGVRRFVEEGELADALARIGIPSVSPERLPLADQVALFERHPLVIAVVGSALHTGLLAASPVDVIGIQHASVLPSDYPMIDTLKGNRAGYYFARGTTTPVTVGETGYQSEFRLHDLAATRDTLLRLVDARLRQPGGA